MVDTNDNSIFSVPHAFFELFADRYLVAEMFFYVMLRKLMAQSATESGWMLLLDTPGHAATNRNRTFAYYGLSPRTCKSARKKLLADGLIVTRYVHDRKGHRVGTEYKLVDEGLARAPKAVHQAILGRLDRGETNGDVRGKDRPLEAFSGIVGATMGVNNSGLDKEG